jgi:voltage-gated potassium channel
VLPNRMARRTAQRRDSRLIGVLRRLYEGESRRALWFRYGLLAFDIATLCFLVLASLIDASSRLDFIELVIGLIILADFIARLLLSRRRFHDLFHPLGLADMAVIISFLIPVSGQGFGFLVALRLFRFYRVGKRMHRDFPFVRRHYDVILAGTHLFVFLFVMTAVVYETQHRHNRAIANYVDALYFTVTTLTTTGFGDITLPGMPGRLLTIAMMLVGISLFLRMVQVLLRPTRLGYRCSSCGLGEHESDAVHCKRCGARLIVDFPESR